LDAAGEGLAAGLPAGAAIGLAAGLAGGADTAGDAAGLAAGDGLTGTVGFSAGVGSGVFAGGLGVWQALSTSMPAAVRPSSPRRVNNAPRDTTDEISDTDIKISSSAHLLDRSLAR
jgi:hypothetical protein